jgi:hypothetical protein
MPGPARKSANPNSNSTSNSNISREQSQVDRLLNTSSLASSISIETPIPHPSINKRKDWKNLIHVQENFQKPDKFGIVECVLCQFGVFDASDGNATEKLLTIYKQQLGKMPDETLYRYLAIYWNDHVATVPNQDVAGVTTTQEDSIIPHVTVSIIAHHFEICYQRRNVEGILFQQIDRLLKIQNRVYENGVFVRTVDDEEQRMADIEGLPRPAPVLTQDANGNIIDEYAHTVRAEPPEDDIRNGSSPENQTQSSPLFTQMTSMIENQINFIKELQERIPFIEDPITRQTYERQIDEQLNKLHNDIRSAQRLERKQRKKIDKKYLVHSREAAVFRDYNRAILYTVRGLKDWREVSCFMDEDTGMFIKPKRRQGRPSNPKPGQNPALSSKYVKPSKFPSSSSGGPPINNSAPKQRHRFSSY